MDNSSKNNKGLAPLFTEEQVDILLRQFKQSLIQRGLVRNATHVGEPHKDQLSISRSDESRKPLDTIKIALPTDYAEMHKMCAALRHTFHNWLAEVIEPALNDYVKSQPSATLTQKRELATWVDKTTRQLGLTTIDPISREPRLFVGEPREPWDRKTGWFALIYIEPNGNIARSFNSTNIENFHLSLSEAPENIEEMFDKLRKHKHVRQ